MGFSIKELLADHNLENLHRLCATKIQWDKDFIWKAFWYFDDICFGYLVFPQQNKVGNTGIKNFHK